MHKKISMTLRDARRLEQELDQLVTRLRDELTVKLKVSIFEPVTDTGLAAARDELLTKVANIDLLTELRFSLRGQVKQANTMTEADDLTRTLAALDAKVRTLSALVASKDEDAYSYRRQGAVKLSRNPIEETNSTTINKQLEVAQAARVHGQAADCITVNLLNGALSKRVEERLAALRKETNATKDKLTVVNQTTKVELMLTPHSEELLKHYNVSVG